MITGYGELSEEQLQLVMPLVLQLKNPIVQNPIPDPSPTMGKGDPETTEEIQFLILDELLKITGSGSYAEMAWLWDSKLITKPFERVRVARKWCYLPAPNYGDTSGIELALTNMYYLRFATSGGKDNKALGNLLAVICRPEQNWLRTFRRFLTTLELISAKRSDFDSEKCESRAAGFLELPLWKAYSILQYWEGMNEQFMKIYAPVFAGDNGDRPLFENGEGWIAVLEDIARDGLYGNFEKVCGTNAHTLWLYLKHCNIRATTQK
jgi:hypothetical protein